MARNKIVLPVSGLIIVLFGLILLSLQLMSSATQEASQLNEMHSWLVIVNVLGSVILFGLVTVNIYSLTKQLKKREAGSRLTLRMMAIFVLLSLAPASIVFYFSVQFLHQGIDSWFNVEMDKAMEDALELSQESLAQRSRWHLKQTQQIAQSLVSKSAHRLAIELEQSRHKIMAAEMTLLSSQGDIITFSSANPTDILPSISVDKVWLQLYKGENYVGFNTLASGELMIQIMVATPQNGRYLQALFPVPERITDLADSIEFAFVRYQQMTFLRNSLKISFLLALSLVLLLSLLAAIWIAFISIGRLVSPVKELVKGTQAVAEGHYQQQLPVMTEDDLGFLVESFNAMTARLSDARDQANQARHEVETQHAYLESLLTNLSSGVISFDAQFRIRTANQTANTILHLKINQFAGYTLLDLVDGNPDLVDILEIIYQQLQRHDTWQQRLAFLGKNGHQELLFRGGSLFSSDGQQTGAVVVFDDVTDLIQAQKNAAWGEVARRLAHEIKNPLTPIQLSAERLQHKLSKVLEPESAKMLARSTQTIVQQVEAMKRMVDDFSEYARASKKHLENIDLVQLIDELILLYAAQNACQFKRDFEINLPLIYADPISIRQVLHNLLKNAQEAIKTEGLITFSLKAVHKQAAEFIEIGIYDNGIGISNEDVATIFEPYVTNKPKGTGLGLAIVKKIIEEHGGRIWVDSNYHQGAGFIIQLPALSARF